MAWPYTTFWVGNRLYVSLFEETTLHVYTIPGFPISEHRCLYSMRSDALFWSLHMPRQRSKQMYITKIKQRWEKLGKASSMYRACKVYVHHLQSDVREYKGMYICPANSTLYHPLYARCCLKNTVGLADRVCLLKSSL